MQNKKVKCIVLSAMLTSISLVFIYFLRYIFFPAAPFLVYDPGDIPLLMLTFIIGPSYGFIATVAVSVFQAIFLSADGWVGALMHIMSTGTLVIVTGILYKTKKGEYSLNRSVIALLAGSLAMTIIMVVSNLTITVWVYGIPRDAVIAMLPSAIIPFNLLKAGINSVIAFIILNRLRKYIKL